MLMENLLLAKAGTIVDAVILVLIAAFLFYGMAKGFTSVLLSTVARIASLVLAVLLCSNLVMFLNDKFNAISAVEGWIKPLLDKIFGEELLNVTIAEYVSSKVDLGTSGISSILLKVVSKILADKNIDPNLTLFQIVSPTIAYYILSAICFVALYILIRVGFVLLNKISKRWIDNISIIKTADRLLGAILSVIYCIFLISAVVSLIEIIPIGFFNKLNGYIQESIVGSFIVNKLNLVKIIFTNTKIVEAIKNVILNRQ